MNAHRLFSLILVLTLLATLTGAASSAPLAEPCVPGTGYDPACDVDQDGVITVNDLQLTAGHWSQTGTYVSDNNHTHLGQTWTGNNNPLILEGSFGSPSWAPLLLGNSAGPGLRVNAGGGSGVWVESAGNNGVLVDSANGDGLHVSSAGTNGVYVGSAVNNGLYLGTAINGLYVNSATSSGVYVNSASHDGIFVCHTGSQSTCNQTSYNNGVEIGNAENNGLFVWSAGNIGMEVLSAGTLGVLVDNAAVTGVYANTTQASGQWGLYTPDAIHGSNVLLHSLSLVAQVSGPDALASGDIVAVAGITDPAPGSTVHTPLVRLAGGTFTSVVGVVASRLVVTPLPSHPQPAGSETNTELRSADGPAKPGDYVALTVMGAARVKVSTANGPVTIGQRLTAADLAGHARALRMRTLDGMVVTEGAPVIGTALEPLASGEGLIWVLVNVQ